MSEGRNNSEELYKIRQNVEAYLASHDVKYVTEDAVFTHMGTGEEYRGREAIAGMLHYMYHVAFDAKAHFNNILVTEDKAMAEGTFMGKHINEFAGLAATLKDVSVPVCITYDLEGGLIKKARVYMLGDVLFQQLQNRSETSVL